MKKVDEKIAKKRLVIFQNIAEKIKLNYKKKLLNQIVKVLFENKMSKRKKINILEEMNIKIRL